MKRIASTCLLAALLASPIAAAGAAPPAAPDTLIVPVAGVEVTALRGRDSVADIPAAAFIVSRDDIRRAGLPRLSTLLQSVPGLYAYGQNSSGDATIVDPRGFTASGESSYLKLLVDGQDVRDVENGNVDWDWVAPGDIERVEVVQGPGAWMYGDASEGGIVNVVRSALRDRLGTEVDARAGSFGLRSGDLFVSGPAGEARVGARGFARDVDGWREHSRERTYGGGADATRRWGGTVVRVDGTGLDTDRQDPGLLTSDAWAVDPSRADPDSRLDYEHARRGQLAVRIQSGEGPEPTWAIAPSARLDDVDQVHTLFYQPLFHHARSSTAGARFEWRGCGTMAGRAVKLQGEAEVEQATLVSDYDAYDATAGRGSRLASTRSWRNLGSASLGARVELGPRTEARLSVRGDLARVHRFDALADTTSATRSLSAVTPLVGVTRRIGSRGNVYGSASTAFRIPTLYQMFDSRPIFFGPPPPLTITNSQLDPQRAVSVEAGGRWSREDGASGQLAAYSTWVRNEIDFDLSTLHYANISRSWHRGVEAGVAWPLPGRLVARAGGAVTPTTFDGGPNDGRQIKSVPLGTGNASLQFAPIPACSADLGARYVGRQFLNDDETHPLGAVVVWDAGLSAHAGRVRGSVRVLNVFGKRYAESGYLDFAQDFSTIERLMPAAPRSVNVTLTLD